MPATRKWSKIIASLLGGWWSSMSGAASIPLAFLAVLVGGKPSLWLAILGYVALWIVVIKMARDRYNIENKKGVAAALSSYFRALDTTIQLLKSWPR
jgi:hypothetical protein